MKKLKTKHEQLSCCRCSLFSFEYKVLCTSLSKATFPLILIRNDNRFKNDNDYRCYKHHQADPALYWNKAVQHVMQRGSIQRISTILRRSSQKIWVQSPVEIPATPTMTTYKQKQKTKNHLVQPTIRQKLKYKHWQILLPSPTKALPKKTQIPQDIQQKQHQAQLQLHAKHQYIYQLTQLKNHQSTTYKHQPTDLQLHG